MAQTTLSIRIDEDVKRQLEFLCNDFGINVTAAITMFAKAVIKERRIPFEISATPVRHPPAIDEISREELSDSIRRALDDYAAGRSHRAEDVFSELDREFGI
jgi:DNA-damage-inducible protein J